MGLHIAGWYLIGWLFVSQSVFLSVSNVYSGGFEDRIFKNLGSRDRILKAKILQ